MGMTEGRYGNDRGKGKICIKMFTIKRVFYLNGELLIYKIRL